MSETTETENPEVTPEAPKRRGRPRKADVEAAEAAKAEEATSASKKRTTKKAAAEETEAVEAAPKKRGRPRKADAAQDADETAVAESEKPKRASRKKAAAEDGEDASSKTAESSPEPSQEGETSVRKTRVRKTVKVETAGSSSDEATDKDSAHGDAAERNTKNAQQKRDRQKYANQQNQQNQQRNQKNNANGNKNNHKNNYNDRDRRRQFRNNNREITPTADRAELEAMKVADLRERAGELGIDGSAYKKAELVDVVYDAMLIAEGFREVTGVLDIMPDGYGFLRTNGYLPGEGDAYVSLSLIRRNQLRKGDMVTGQTRPMRDNDKYAAIQKIISVNGTPAEELEARPKFADLTPVYPDEILKMEHGKSSVTARVIDLAAPIGKGQRGLIVSPPKAGKTTVLKDIAAAISANNPDVHLMCLLVDERPEEVTDMERSIKGEVISSTFDMPTENHIAVSELVIERAKRLVEQGKDVVILLDSITRLARAYNLATPASGRILSGGVDSTALYPPKRFLGAARNIENGGSLTILASALIDTGSKMDEVIFEEFKGTGNMELKLDRNLADRRIFPAIDVVASGTRKEELLLNPQEAPLIWAVRRILSNMNNTERSMDMLVKSLKQTDNNQEFLIRTAKKAQSQQGKLEENFEL